MNLFACIDIGGTETKIGFLTKDATIVALTSIKTRTGLGPSVWMHDISEIINKMKQNYDICAICVSSTGMIDSDTGKVVFALPQVPDYTGFDIKGFFEKECNLPCEVENDVNCMVLAESISGAGKGCSSVLGLTIGTGVGGGFTVNGKLLKGSNHSFCEVGYISVGSSDLEHTGSTTALIKNVAKLKNQNSELWDGKKVFKAAQDGDSICIYCIEQMALCIADGLKSLSYVLDPQIIVIGGGIVNEDSLLQKIRQNFRRNIPVERAYYRNSAGLVGALYNFLQKTNLSIS